MKLALEVWGDEGRCHICFVAECENRNVPLYAAFAGLNLLNEEAEVLGASHVSNFSAIGAMATAYSKTAQLKGGAKFIHCYPDSSPHDGIIFSLEKNQMGFRKAGTIKWLDPKEAGMVMARAISKDPEMATLPVEGEG
jgi:hypothetical protein